MSIIISFGPVQPPVRHEYRSGRGIHMPKILTLYSDYFLARHDCSDYLTKARAKLLLVFLTLFLFFTLLLQFSMLFAGWYDFLVTIPITSLLLLGLVASLVMLRIGRYLLSANIFITFATIAVIAGLIRQPFQELNLSYTSYIFFIFPCVSLCAVFSDIRFLTVICAILSLADTALFIILRQLSPPSDSKMIIIAFNNTMFSLAIVYIISFLIMRIFRKSVEVANDEARKSQDANTFIKKVLNESSARVVEAMQVMSDQSDAFSESAHDQASSINRINTTIGTISGGIDEVSGNAKEQNVNLNSLIAILDELSHIIREIDTAIGDSLQATGDIVNKARDGENHLRAMEERIGRVKGSSSEMANIIGIINDISDQINLLSLNAAIEAARAGDSGRGFAVVADEISKLADRTASSIKSIESIIKTNEEEIDKGLSGVAMTVSSISTIIQGVNAVNEKIKALSDYKRKQSETNEMVNSNAVMVRKRSEEITAAAERQKEAIADIVRNVEAMNEVSQNNSVHAVKMAYDSQNLVDLVLTLKQDIERYGN
jgi:methyl-accepting chemotaxis protein